MMVLALSLVVAAAAVPGTGALATPSPRPQPIVGGERVDASEWLSVVAILGVRSGVAFDTVDLCTGVLLSPEVVLTAGHCLRDADTVDELRVVFGDTIYTSDPNRRTVGEAYFLHPEFCLDTDDEDCEREGYDFGVVLLRDRARGVEVIPPVVTQEEWDEAMVRDQPVVFVGFGATSSDEDRQTDPEEVGYKRAVTTVITGFENEGSEFSAGSPGKDTCFGDSGGPAFVQLASGEWRLVGITSRGEVPCGSGRGLYGVPYVALPWVREITGLNLLPPGCEEADCLDIIPPGRCGCRLGDPEDPEGSQGLAFFLWLGVWGMVGSRRSRGE